MERVDGWFATDPAPANQIEANGPSGAVLLARVHSRPRRQSEREYLDRLRHEVDEIWPQAKSTKASLADRMKLIEELRAFLASSQRSDTLDWSGARCDFEAPGTRPAARRSI
jgi:hypothetical protein